MDDNHIFAFSVMAITFLLCLPILTKANKLKPMNLVTTAGHVYENIFDQARVKTIGTRIDRNGDLIIKYVKDQGNNQIFESPRNLFENQYKRITSTPN